MQWHQKWQKFYAQKFLQQKKISFISAIFITIGSSVGSGFFFKSSQVLENAGFSFPLTILAWVIAALAVLALGYALVAVTSMQKKANNLSMIGWSKQFASAFWFKACKNFMYYVYLPLNFFAVPLYAFNALQDALVGFGLINHFNTNADFAIWALCGFITTAYFVFTSGLKPSWFNIQNWLLTIVKFIPLVAVALLSISLLATNGIDADKLNIAPVGFSNISDFAQLSPGIGLFISLAAIFFAFDGFYCAHGLQNVMAKPEKTSYAVMTGLGVTALIFLLLAILLTLAQPDSARFSNFLTFLDQYQLGWLFGIFNLAIFFGVLGIVNSFAMWATRVTEELLGYGLLFGFHKLQKKLNSNKPVTGAIYFLSLTFAINLVFTLIGGLTYLPSNAYLTNAQSLYDGTGFNSMARLLSFADLMANWTSILVFVFIVQAIYGCYKQKIKQKQTTSKLMHVSMVLAIVILAFSLAFQFVAPLANIVLLITNPALQTPGEFLFRILVVVVLLIYALLMFVPSYFDYDAKRFGTQYLAIYQPLLT